MDSNKLNRNNISYQKMYDIYNSDKFVIALTSSNLHIAENYILGIYSGFKTLKHDVVVRKLKNYSLRIIQCVICLFCTLLR